jgi:predicted RNA-binding protein Jag
VAGEESFASAGEEEVTEPVEAVAPSANPSADVDRSAQAAAVLRELLRLADVPATLDVKDTADGGISIALALGAELPGVALGRRGTFVDALQFLVNKLTHRPGSERRWVSLGLGEHPAPRLPRPAARPEGNGASRPPAPVRAAASVPSAKPTAREEPPAPPPPRPPVVVAPVVEVTEDEALTLAARAMAAASAQTGRFYGVVALSEDDRVRMLRAVADVAGVRAAAEGEGRLRRLVFTPDRPTPMPKRTHPMGVDVDELAGPDGAG